MASCLIAATAISIWVNAAWLAAAKISMSSVSFFKRASRSLVCEDASVVWRKSSALSALKTLTMPLMRFELFFSSPW